MQPPDNPIISTFLSCRNLLVRALLKLSVKPADMDDILQESLLRTLEADRKRKIEFPKSYLVTVTRNVVFEQLRRSQRETQQQIDEVQHHCQDSPCDEQAHAQQMLSVFWEVLAQLPQSHQRAILLRRVYGLSHQEVAQKMGVSLSSVEKYFAQGMRRCLALMQARGYSPAALAQQVKNHD